MQFNEDIEVLVMADFQSHYIYAFDFTSLQDRAKQVHFRNLVQKAWD